MGFKEVAKRATSLTMSKFLVFSPLSLRKQLKHNRKAKHLKKKKKTKVELFLSWEEEKY